MIGPILLAVSWVLLRLEAKSLRVLGFNLPLRRLGELALGFFATGIAAAIQQVGYALATGETWQLNATFTWAAGVQQMRSLLNSVLYEELVFRGYLLYQAIRFLGEKRGVWLGAVAFGIYHWFSFGVLGNPVAMVYVFLMTGAFGAMGAFAFARTGSLAAPIGLHLGWNFVTYLVFSAGPAGAALLVPASGVARLKAPGAAGLLLGLGLPILMMTAVIMLLRRYRPVAMSDPGQQQKAA